MKKYINILLIILFVILEVFLLSNSKIVIYSFRKTLNICLYNLMPTMFFSIIISQILIKLNIKNYIPNFIKNIFIKLFNINQNDVIIFLLSILSGYPNNGKMLINNKNLNNIILYTNFVNPIFLICTVGGIYLKNIKLALIILISHYISNIILGIILRKNNINDEKEIKNDNKSFLNIYNSSLKDTIYTLSIIFSNILFFSIIISLYTNITNINEPINSVLIGLIEFSSGIYNISILNINLFLKGLIILIIITFGSFSIHMQMISINDKIKYIKYLFYRILNVFISIIIYLVITAIV
ncbi:MAG: hypothetical protein IJ105_02225 [Bacilli bacterium]|nr:hypothetical protein [Bacilli bacterium]